MPAAINRKRSIPLVLLCHVRHRFYASNNEARSGVSGNFPNAMEHVNPFSPTYY